MNVVGWYVLRNLRWLVLIAAIVTLTLCLTLLLNETSTNQAQGHVTITPTISPNLLSPTDSSDTSAPTDKQDGGPSPSTSSPISLSVSPSSPHSVFESNSSTTPTIESITSPPTTSPSMISPSPYTSAPSMKLPSPSTEAPSMILPSPSSNAPSATTIPTRTPNPVLTSSTPPTSNSASPSSNSSPPTFNPTMLSTPELTLVPPLEYVGEYSTNASLFPLGMCQGNCDNDQHCGIGLSCFDRVKRASVPGCSGDTNDEGIDICYAPPPGVLVVVARNRKSSLGMFPLEACQGRCRRDSDCKDDLICHERKGNERIPGCEGSGVEGESYCAVAPTPSPMTVTPTQSPTRAKVPNPTAGTSPSMNKVLRVETECSPSSPCGQCQGDCKGNDSNCRQDLGLVCFSRKANKKVFGCNKGGDGDLAGVDFCTRPKPSTKKAMTYVPGEATVIESGLLLSTGLTAKCIATKGERVLYVDGSESEEEFHEDPDGGAVFLDEATGGWIYVSNAESGKNGGVGAIRFNAKGDVVDYQMVATKTRRNCGGGKTFWNTWLTCEETKDGHVWEVDPWGNRVAKKTIIGIEDGDEYESAAYDNRDPKNPKFFVTVDADEGALIKFEPDRKAIKKALSTDPPDYSNLLYSNETGTATRQFLVIEPESKKEDKGTFFWTDDLDEARENADEYYQNCEGIDFREGILYFTCKKDKVLFIVDIDNGTYKRESTKSGTFSEGPDQVARLLGDGKDGDILYFCEDGGRESVCGVHGRDKNGQFYSILESHDPEFTGETSGLAFSPDNSHLYVSFQSAGKIFDVTRTDGYPFGGQRLDVKYHASENNLFRFPVEE